LGAFFFEVGIGGVLIENVSTGMSNVMTHATLLRSMEPVVSLIIPLLYKEIETPQTASGYGHCSDI